MVRVVETDRGSLMTFQQRAPHMLFILSDDHAAHALGCYGSRVNKTPALDRIADEGIRFDEAGCANSLCAPSRATLLTGTHSHVNGMYTLVTSFDSSQPTFPAILQREGYRTALFGKWHLGHGAGHDPVGFDEWRVLDEQGDYYDPLLIGPDGARRFEGYVTELLTDLALDWLSRQPEGQPWCVLLWHKAPHRRWEPGPAERDLFPDDLPVPKTFFDDHLAQSAAAREAAIRVDGDLDELDFKEPVPGGLDERESALWKYQRYMKDYLRCVEGIDRSTARLLDHLDERGLADNTLVTYASDQGFFLGDHGWFDKRLMYRDSLRMPLMMRYPGRIPAASVSNDLVLNLDLAPTFLDFAGIKVPERMQGESIRALATGERQSWRDHTYYRYWDHLKAGVGAHCGVRTHEYKLIHYYGDGLGIPGAIDELRTPEWELFDLSADPDELMNVADDAYYAETRADLTDLLLRAIDDAGDTRPPSLIGWV